MKLLSKYPTYVIALLMAALVTSPRLILAIQNTENQQLTDFALQAVFAFVYAFTFLELNERIKWQTWKKLCLFLLIHLILTFIFANLHLLLLGIEERKGIVRYGYHFRNLMLLVSSVIISGFMKTLQQKQVLLIQNKTLEAENLQAQLSNLQQQLNPHFLFNSLNSLHSLIAEDPQQSQEFVKNLAHVFRYSLDFQKKKLITIQEEIAFLDAYIYLLKIRFGDRLEFNLENTKNIKGLLPPFALQLLIENAVNHNEISSKKNLHINISSDEVHSFLVVRNNLNSKRQPMSGAGVGLANLNNRYLLLAGKPIDIEQNSTFFEVKIPILVDENINY